MSNQTIPQQDDDSKYITGPSQPSSHLPDLYDFAKRNNLEIGSTTNGRHNVGSKHYSGNAFDIKGSGAWSDTQVQALSEAAQLAGFKLRDERVRPKGQEVWGGPHVHIEYASDPVNEDAKYFTIVSDSLPKRAKVGVEVKPYEPQAVKPITFEEADEKEPEQKAGLNRSARAARRLLENVKTQGMTLPSNHPDLLGKAVTLTFDHSPTAEDINDAFLSQYGYDDVNVNFKSETGMLLAGNLGGDLTPKQSGNQFTLTVHPTRGAIEAINAYASGGLSALRNTTESQQLGRVAVARDMEVALKDAGVRADLQKIGAEQYMASAQYVENLKNLALYAGQYLPHDPTEKPTYDPEFKSSQAIAESRTELPKNRTWTGAIAEQPISALGAITRAQTVPLGVAGFPMQQAIENAQAGPEAAFKAAVMTAPLMAAGPIARSVGADAMSPITRQAFMRGLQATSAAGTAAATGAEPKEIGKQALVGAFFPTGPREFVHAQFGRLVESENQAGISASKIRVTDEQGNDHVIIKPSIRKNQRAIPLQSTPAEGLESPLKEVPQVSADIPQSQGAVSGQEPAASPALGIEPERNLSSEATGILRGQSPTTEREPLRGQEPKTLEALTRAELKQRVKQGGTRADEYRNELERRRISRSLSGFVRDQGGISYKEQVAYGSKASDLRGKSGQATELGMLSPRETGTTGLLNKGNRQGSQRYSAEYMMDAANAEGYRDLDGQPFDSIGNFLDAVASDSKGRRQYTRLGEENAIDFEKEWRDYGKTQQDEHDANETVTLLENEGTGQIYDRIASGQANESEVSQFRAAAEKLGISEEHTENIIASARSSGIQEASETPFAEVADASPPARQTVKHANDIKAAVDSGNVDEMNRLLEETRITDADIAANAAKTKTTQDAPIREGQTPETTRPLPDRDSPTQRERSFPQTLEKAGLPKGSNLYYDVQSHAETLKRAERIISDRGEQGALAWAMSESKPSAEQTAVGDILIKRMQDAGNIQGADDLASSMSERLTKLGQSIDAAKLVSSMSPEGILRYANRRIQAKNPEQRLSTDDAKTLIALAGDLKESNGQFGQIMDLLRSLESRVSTLETIPKRGNVKSKASSLQVKLDEQAEAARERLKARVGVKGSQAGASTIPVDIADYAIIGASKLARKGIDLAVWTQEMIDEFGETIRPHLQKIWTASWKLKEDARKELGQSRIVNQVTGGEPENYSPKEIKDLINQATEARKRATVARTEMQHLFERLESTPRQRTIDKIADVLNVPRAAMSSADISAALRQGSMFTLTEFREAGTATTKMLRAFNNEQYQTIMTEMLADPSFLKVRHEMGVDFSSPELRAEGSLPEEFYQSTIAEKYIPGVKRSEQAYTTYLDSARLFWGDKFGQEVEEYAAHSGWTEVRTQGALKQAGKFINVSTGRGSLEVKLAGKTLIDLTPASPILSAVFFAPRYLASRLQLLNMALNPYELYKLEPPVRKIVMRKAARYMATQAGIYTLAGAAGAQTNATNPNDSDWLKIKIGNTRYDTLAGMQQPMRTMYLITKEFPSFMNSDPKKADAAKERAWDAITRFLEYKEAPIPSGINAYRRGHELFEPPHSFTLKKAILKRAVPLVLQDMYDAWTEEGTSGLGKAILKASPSAIGIGTQTYSDMPQRRVPTASPPSAPPPP